MKQTLHGRMTIGTVEERLTAELNIPDLEVKIVHKESGRDVPDHANITRLREKNKKS